MYAMGNPSNYIDPSGYAGAAIDYQSQTQQSIKATKSINHVFAKPVNPAADPLLLTIERHIAYRLWWLILILLLPGDQLHDPDQGLGRRPGTDPNPAPNPDTPYQPTPAPGTDPQPTPGPSPSPTPTPTPSCESQSFVTWWSRLTPVFSSLRTDEDWYQYEQRVARGNGAYGDYARRVETGPIDADGIEPTNCFLVDAKFARNPNAPQYRLDGPPWLTGDESNDVTDIVDEFRRYKRATDSSIAEGLIVRTNAQLSVAFFQALLTQSGFVLGTDAFVELVP